MGQAQLQYHCTANLAFFLRGEHSLQFAVAMYSLPQGFGLIFRVGFGRMARDAFMTFNDTNYRAAYNCTQIYGVSIIILPNIKVLVIAIKKTIHTFFKERRRNIFLEVKNCLR